MSTNLLPEEEDNEVPDIHGSVELVASGYEWICPECEEFNDTIEVTETVICSKCEKSFSVTDYYHAIG